MFMYVYYKVSGHFDTLSLATGSHVPVLEFIYYVSARRPSIDPLQELVLTNLYFSFNSHLSHVTILLQRLQIK